MKHRRLLLSGLFLSAFFCLAALALISVPTASFRSRAAPSAPVLLTRANLTRAIALEPATNLAEPFLPQTAITFGTDNRTRVMLFATNLTLAAGEGPAAVIADAEDGSRMHYPLAVEYVAAVPGQNWVTEVVVRLNDSLGDAGDVLVGITYQGMTSNRVRIGIGAGGDAIASGQGAADRSGRSTRTA